MSKYIDVEVLMQQCPGNLKTAFIDHDIAQYNKGWNACNKLWFSLIKEMPAADVEPVREWIPCSERLPEESYGCLVFVEATDRYTGEDYTTLLPRFAGYDGERWNDDDGQEVPFEVLAWQKLPEPPKMDGGTM